ncbi:unnamed protein product [Rhodiola kirilowii]
MDFLAVAAAAGAGYVAKYLHKMSKDNDGESSSESANTAKGRQERDNTSSLNDIAKCDGSYKDLRSFGGNVGPLMNTVAESNCEGLEDLGRYQDCNLLSLTSLPPVVDEKEILRLSGNIGEDELRENLGEVEFAHRFSRSRLIRSRKTCGNIAKPLNSLESCLTAQLYKQHSSMENYVPTPLPSPSARTRPLLVTDGKRVISRASSEFQAGMRLEVSKIENKILLGAPPLPKRSMEMKRRPKQTSGEKWYRKLSSSTADAEPLNRQASPSGMLVFFIGVTIGILSTAVANKREVDKLSELLKQSKNLVQDLHEEIEMKDSMTVKELVIENACNQESDRTTDSLEDPTTRAENMVDSEKDFSKEDDRNAKQSEIMSQIEAELEAELERLELNMKGSSTLERIGDFVELDPNYEADFTTGEFRLDTVSKQLNIDSESDENNQDGTSTGHTDHANRPVSPRELSLRLHEVIEARLEARIMELEKALEDSQKRVRSLEHSSNKTRTCVEKGTASPQSQSSASLDDQNNFDQPLVINLAGDALDAYNEAYEEIFRMVKTEDETPPDTTFNDNFNKPEAIFSQSMTNIPVLQNISVEERSPIASIERINWQEQLSENIESDDESEGEGEGDDILGKLLIQQIVEKTRQGSPLVLNAQRMLYSMDE